MTLSEFKAWFEGFTESMDGAPSKKQWERIQDRVKEISGAPVTERIYIDRYVQPYWQRYWVSTGAMPLNGVSYSSAGCVAQNATSAYQAGTLSAQPFESHKAMAALGRLEAQNMAA